jgi:hypothetical protein
MNLELEIFWAVPGGIRLALILMGKSIVIQPLIGLAINLARSIILDFIPTIDLMRLWILWVGIIIRIVSLVLISIDI